MIFLLNLNLIFACLKIRLLFKILEIKIMIVLQHLTYLVCLINIASSTLGPGDKKSKKSKKTEYPQTVPVKLDGDVFDRKLVQEEISIKSIIQNYKHFSLDRSKIKRFENKVLGYVTPWNSKGYDHSKTFANKLDIISPVWLQIERVGRLKYELKGTHDIDKNWIVDVRKSSDKNEIEFLPRILFENLKMEDLNAMFNSEEELAALG